MSEKQIVHCTGPEHLAYVLHERPWMTTSVLPAAEFADEPARDGLKLGVKPLACLYLKPNDSNVLSMKQPGKFLPAPGWDVSP